MLSPLVATVNNYVAHIGSFPFDKGRSTKSHETNDHNFRLVCFVRSFYVESVDLSKQTTSLTQLAAGATYLGLNFSRRR
ncbi:MAG: hypothetical protein QOH71_1107 [Blastocatellia bacterium]|jgi:hypothetical protein|nr:hypothetical protein [Blastocatellia bacterium]